MKTKLFIISIGCALSLQYAGASMASIETFDTAASAASNGFQLSSNIYYYNAGRPYLEMWNEAHTITATAGTFTFNSLDFNYYPDQVYTGGNGSNLNMVLKDINGSTLLDVNIAIPTDRSWITYSNNVTGVHEIYFAPTMGFWPSVDNLNYNSTAPVPVPAAAWLLGSGLLGLIGVARRKAA